MSVPNIDLNQFIRKGNAPNEGQKSNGVIDLNQFIRPKEPEQDNRSILDKSIGKAGRLGGQFALGAIQRTTAPYDIGAIAAKKFGEVTAPAELRTNLLEEIGSLQEEKARGEWDENKQKEYDYYVNLIKNPEEMKKHIKEVPNLDVGSLIESGAKKAGIDLTPQSADEMALRWVGFIKDPKKAQELMKGGLNTKNALEIFKALIPSGKELARGASAGIVLEEAAANELGPIGTMASLILADMAPSLALSTGKAALQFAKNPITTTKSVIEGTKELGKTALAKGIAAITPRDKKLLQQTIINDFKDAGLQADFGTITGNNVFKWLQNTLSQSGLTGKPLEEFRNSLTKNIVNEYEKIAGELGKSVFESHYEAGEALKSALEKARDLDASEYRDLYKSAIKRSGDKQVYTGNVGSLIKELEAELAPGAYKSNEQQAVLNILDKLKSDVMTSEGGIKSAEIKTLINNKLALNDAINYEVQGGAKKLLRAVVKQIDDAITEHGKGDPQFAKEWKMANDKFGKHAKLFRGKTISNALKTQDPEAIFKKMNTSHGISEIRKALSATPEGKELFKQLSALKLEDMIGKNLVDSTTGQLNLGKFSKLLEKGQSKAVVKELLGTQNLAKLEKLQNASGRLADTAQKFFNASKSGVYGSDYGVAAKIIYDFINVFTGNPWPLVRSGGILLGSRNVAKLMADPKFLTLLEEAMFNSQKGTRSAFLNTGKKLAGKAKEILKSAYGEAKKAAEPETFQAAAIQGGLGEL